MVEVDITKVDISARGLAMLFVGILIIIVIAGVAFWAYKRVTGAVAPAPTVQAGW